jgi:hypothetical protein
MITMGQSVSINLLTGHDLMRLIIQPQLLGALGFNTLLSLNVTAMIVSQVLKLL